MPLTGIGPLTAQYRDQCSSVILVHYWLGSPLHTLGQYVFHIGPVPTPVELAQFYANVQNHTAPILDTVTGPVQSDILGQYWSCTPMFAGEKHPENREEKRHLKLPGLAKEREVIVRHLKVTAWEPSSYRQKMWFTGTFRVCFCAWLRDTRHTRLVYMGPDVAQACVYIQLICCHEKGMRPKPYSYTEAKQTHQSTCHQELYKVLDATNSRNTYFC